MKAEDLLAHAIELLRANAYGFLITTGANSTPHARLVQPLHLSDGAEITIGTSPRSRKVADISAFALVTFAVEDRAHFAYVTLSGRARVSDDITLRRQRWAAGLEAFFPGGPTGDDFVLVLIHVERIELMSFAQTVHPAPYGLVPAVIDRQGGRWRLIDAERSPSTSSPR